MAGQKRANRKCGRSRDKCQRYLVAHRRIKNKTRKLEKRIKNLHPDTKVKVRLHCPIGRLKER